MKPRLLLGCPRPASPMSGSRSRPRPSLSASRHRCAHRPRAPAPPRRRRFCAHRGRRWRSLVVTRRAGTTATSRSRRPLHVGARGAARVGRRDLLAARSYAAFGSAPRTSATLTGSSSGRRRGGSRSWRSTRPGCAPGRALALDRARRTASAPNHTSGTCSATRRRAPRDWQDLRGPLHQGRGGSDRGRWSSVPALTSRATPRSARGVGHVAGRHGHLAVPDRRHAGPGSTVRSG